MHFLGYNENIILLLLREVVPVNNYNINDDNDNPCAFFDAGDQRCSVRRKS